MIPTSKNGAAVALVAALCLLMTQASAADSQAMQRIEGSRLVDAAQAALRHQLEQNATQVHTRPRQVPAAISVPHGEVELHAQADTTWAPAMRVVVSTQVQGHVVRRTPVWFAVQVHMQAPVAAHDLPSGHRLTEDDLRMASVDLAAIGQSTADSVSALLGRRLKRAVPQGQALLARQAEDIPDVVRGARVLVELDAAGIAISVPGVALADARLGQPVRVRMPRDTVLTATVTGLQRARINHQEVTP
jgi:flagella basal body P-ring formation protein FlgA